MAEKDLPISLLKALYKKYSGNFATSIVPLPESGSYRRYYRISAGNETVMGVHNAAMLENKAFIYLNRHLLKTGNNVPVVYTEDLDRNIYLEQDLGDITLLDYLEQIRKEEH